MPTMGEYFEVAICNMALAEIGRGAQITALDEASQAARACKLRYPYARDAVLRAYDWNFAGRRAEIAKNAVAPAFEYANAYDLPADCLLVRTVFGGDAEKWVVEGRQILTDMGDPIFVKYTALVTDVAQFDPLFVEALSARIGSDIAVQLSESVSRSQGLWQVYQAKLVDARRRDAQEGQPDQFPGGSWLDARFGGGANAYSDWRGE
ncbi:MAG: hypothetical protein K8S25_01435 [Alphaproteobacteria bacterium]|nr:hypothetical protein [Alphaproteobacteria bacterium]